MSIKILLTAFVLPLFITACSDKDGPDNIEPELLTGEATDITRTEATVTGKVTLHGNTAMPELNFCYGTTPATENRTGSITPVNNNVTARLTGLTPGTLYYFRLQGSNGHAVIYGDTSSFTTQPNEKPEIGELAVLGRGPSSVIISFEITADGGEDITETGCYITEEGSENTEKITAVTAGDTVRMRIGGLRLNASYVLVPFAANKVGETTGNPLSIVTGNAVTLTEPGTLSEIIGDDTFSHEALAFTGPMNGDDLRCLRLMMGREADGSPTAGRLSHVNMTDVRIVSGGGSYDSSRFSENDVVGYGLFADCNILTDLSLPAGATVIEKDALRGCTGLEHLVIPAAAVNVTPSSGCTSLAEISVNGANSNYKSYDGVLYNAGMTNIVWFPMGKKGDCTLPDALTDIGD